MRAICRDRAAKDARGELSDDDMFGNERGWDSDEEYEGGESNPVVTIPKPQATAAKRVAAKPSTTKAGTGSAAGAGAGAGAGATKKKQVSARKPAAAPAYWQRTTMAHAWCRVV